MRKKLYSITSLFLFFVATCYGNDRTVPLDKPVIVPNNLRYVEYNVNLDKQPRQETINTLLSRMDQFVSLDKLPVDPEKHESEYWILVPVVNNGTTEKIYFTELSKGYFWKAYLFVLNSEGQLLKEESYSVLRDNFNRNVMLPRVSFPFSIGPGEEKVLVVRVKAYDIFKVPLRLVTMKHHIRSVFVVHVLIGIFFGVLGGLFVYNTVLYFSMRERWLLFYLLAVLSASMYILVSGRIIFLFAEAPSIFAAVTIVLVLLFTRSFLLVKEGMPFMDLLLLVHIILISFDIVMFPLVRAELFFTLHNFFIVSSMASMIIVGITAVVKKVRYGILFLSGFTLFCFGVVTSLLNEHGVRYGGLTFILSKAEQPGFVFSLLVFAFIVSDRMRTLRQAKMVAEEKLGFFTGLSHELRTPLTNLTLPLERILRGDEGELISCKSKLFRQMQRQTKRLHHHIENMLYIYKFDSAVMKMNAEYIDAVAFCREYLAEFRSFAENKGIELQFIDSTNNGARAWGDRKLFESAILNLIGNGVKFTHTGMVTVTVTEEEKDVRITVTDTGEGIPEEELHKVFTKYYSAGSARGFGIGLALVKEIVSLHGGKIDIESTVGQGTSVSVVFPGTPESSAIPSSKKESVTGGRPPLAGNRAVDHDSSAQRVTSLKSTSRPEPRPQWPGRQFADRREQEKRPDSGEMPADAGVKAPLVLLVEDDPDLLSSLVRLLSPRFEVVTAVNGEEGLERLESVRPGIIISDVMMPKMDGFEFIKKVRDKDETGAIPFIFLTALNAQEDVIEGLHYGAVAYIRKPFNGEEFIERVSAIINSQRRFIHEYDRKFKEYLNKWDPLVTDTRTGNKEGAPIVPDMQKCAELYRLTEKQTEILELVVKGYTNKEIAELLTVSKKTVDNHVSAILKKTGVNRRTQLSFELLH